MVVSYYDRFSRLWLITLCYGAAWAGSEPSTWKDYRYVPAIKMGGHQMLRDSSGPVSVSLSSCATTPQMTASMERLHQNKAITYDKLALLVTIKKLYN